MSAIVWLSYPARGMWIEISKLMATYLFVVSYPARGMWIEIFNVDIIVTPPILSYPARGMWIEIPILSKHALQESSYPARGMWIEISYGDSSWDFEIVVPREGYVD